MDCKVFRLAGRAIPGARLSREAQSAARAAWGAAPYASLLAVGPLHLVVTVTDALDWLPAASVAVTDSVCAPEPAFFVFQL
jgi:hypothetical protein